MNAKTAGIKESFVKERVFDEGFGILRKDIVEFKNDLIRWMFIFCLANTLSMFILLYLFFRK